MKIAEIGIRPLTVLGLLAITCSLYVTGCATDSGNGGEPTQDLELVLGSPAEISMQETTGTGYSWMLAEFPSCLLLADVDFMEPSTPMPGSPGRRVFTFIPTRTCDGDLRFVLVRPFEPTKPAGTAIYRVHVITK